jgi:hypothetical protein
VYDKQNPLFAHDMLNMEWPCLEVFAMYQNGIILSSTPNTILTHFYAHVFQITMKN